MSRQNHQLPDDPSKLKEMIHDMKKEMSDMTRAMDDMRRENGILQDMLRCAVYKSTMQERQRLCLYSSCGIQSKFHT